MKKHLIHRTKREKESSYDNTYSTYRNPDEALRKEIQDFKIDETKITLGWPEKDWTIVAYEGDEVKCKSGKNIHYFPLEEVKKAQKENHQYQLNQKYQAYKYFKQHFGIVSELYRDKEYGGVHLTRIDIQSGLSTGSLVGIERDLNPMNVEFYGDEHEYDFRCYGDEIELEVNPYRGTSMNLYFNKDGDYVNRDYNVDLNKYKQNDISPDVVLKAFEEKILSLGTLQYSHGKYFSRKFCYIPFAYSDENGGRDIKCGVELIPAQDEITYKKYRTPAIKLPKKPEKKTGKDLLEHLYSIMPAKMKEAFSITTPEPILETIKD